jgi:hypothetical protein
MYRWLVSERLKFANALRALVVTQRQALSLKLPHPRCQPSSLVLRSKTQSITLQSN